MMMLADYLRSRDIKLIFTFFFFENELASCRTTDLEQPYHHYTISFEKIKYLQKQGLMYEK